MMYVKQKQRKGKIVIERKDGYESWNDEGKIDGCASFTIKGNTIKGKRKRGKNNRVAAQWLYRGFARNE